jgi:ATP:corrinoid adenosyltransferase
LNKRGDYITVDEEKRKKLVKERAELVKEIEAGKEEYAKQISKCVADDLKDGILADYFTFDEMVKSNKNRIAEIDRILAGKEPRQKCIDESMWETLEIMQKYSPDKMTDDDKAELERLRKTWGN